MNKVLQYTRKIQDIEYDAEKNILTVHFNSKIMRRYFNVPRQVHENLEKAQDKDQFYQDEIDGSYAIQWFTDSNDILQRSMGKDQFYQTVFDKTFCVE